jgi:hypothetical protein
MTLEMMPRTAKFPTKFLAEFPSVELDEFTPIWVMTLAQN